MFLLWTSDHSPYKTNSMASRWPIAILPASLYKVDEDDTNLTIQAATQEIAVSFAHLANHGVKLRDLESMGGGVVLWFCISVHVETEKNLARINLLIFFLPVYIYIKPLQYISIKHITKKDFGLWSLHKECDVPQPKHII